MPNPQDDQAFRDALQAESLARFPGNSESAKKARKGFRNTERLSLGFKKEGRGGLAGVYDRNKDVIIPVAAGALGLLTGGVATPALAAAAARGLDREGKGGFGFDLGNAAGGAMEGLAAGSLGKFAGSMMPGAGAAGSAAGATAAAPASSLTSSVRVAPPAGVAPLPGGVFGAVGEVPMGSVAGAASPIAAAPASSFSLPQIAGKSKDWLTANGGRNALGLATGVSGVLQQQRGNELMAQAAKAESQRWAENAPLRDAGRAGMLAGAPGNPFARRGV